MSLNSKWFNKSSVSLADYVRAQAWFYRPSKDAVFFAFRGIIASFLALTIALWMQMDSPRWAVMTVWIVAQVSRGETISRSKWRIVGTVVGVVVAIVIVSAFPQQPILFEITIALWTATTCWFAALIRNSSSYSVVLAGYTCALIAFGSIHNPDEVFMLAMSRGSYVILGIICQSFVERIFFYNMSNNARLLLNSNLLSAITGGLQIVKEVLSGDSQAAFRAKQVFTAIAAFKSSIEFRTAELMKDDRTGDHVHATLFSISTVLTRVINVSVYMSHFKKDSSSFEVMSSKIQLYLTGLIKALEQQHDFNDYLLSLRQLRWECRQNIANCIFHDAEETYATDGHQEDVLLNDRIIYRALSELLGEIEIILIQYEHSLHPQKNDHFKFKMTPIYNFRLAWRNGFRVFVAVLVSCFFWEITAWDQSPTAIALLTVACGRLSLFENSYKMCLGFFKGSVIAIVVGGLLNVTLMPDPTTIEGLCLILLVPMFVGGLAIYNLATRSMAMSFCMFFPFLVIFGNGQRMDEITFINTALALVMGVGIAAFSFRFIAPYDPKKVRREIRERILRSMRALPTTMPIPNARLWLAETTDWFISLMGQFDPVKESILIQKYNHGALAVMAIGLNVIELRTIIRHDILPEDIKDELRVVMRRVSNFRAGRQGRTVLITKSAVRRFRIREKTEKNLAQRLEIATAISCLTLISYALEKNMTFLNFQFNKYRRR